MSFSPRALCCVSDIRSPCGLNVWLFSAFPPLLLPSSWQKHRTAGAWKWPQSRGSVQTARQLATQFRCRRSPQIIEPLNCRYIKIPHSKLQPSAARNIVSLLQDARDAIACERHSCKHAYPQGIPAFRGRWDYCECLCLCEGDKGRRSKHKDTQPITAGLFKSPANRSALFRLNTSAAAFHKTTHTWDWSLYYECRGGVSLRGFFFPVLLFLSSSSDLASRLHPKSLQLKG